MLNSFERKLFGWGFVVIIVILTGGLLQAYFYHNYSETTKSKDSKGVYYFEACEHEGCISSDYDYDYVMRIIELGGAKFVRHDPDASTYQNNCFGNKLTHAVIDNAYALQHLEYFKFPVRMVFNSPMGDAFISNEYMWIGLFPVLYFFAATFIILYFLRKKFIAISYLFILLVSLVVACISLLFHDMGSMFQIYIYMFEDIYSVSNLIYLFVLSYFLLYLIFTPIYHFTMFRLGRVTELMASTIAFVDKYKRELNL